MNYVWQALLPNVAVVKNIESVLSFVLTQSYDKIIFLFELFSLHLVIFFDKDMTIPRVKMKDNNVPAHILFIRNDLVTIPLNVIQIQIVPFDCKMHIDRAIESTIIQIADLVFGENLGDRFESLIVESDGYLRFFDLLSVLFAEIFIKLDLIFFNKQDILSYWSY